LKYHDTDDVLMPGPVSAEGPTGIIGGKGLLEGFRFSWDPETLKASKAEQRTVHTPYGPVTAKLGCIRNMPVIVISREGDLKEDVERPPRHRANIWALKELGVEKIFSISSATSVNKEIGLGTIVFPDQYVDLTGRPVTFEGVPVDMEEPFCPEMRTHAYSIALSLGMSSRGKGTYVNITGPSYPTVAETELVKKVGGDIVGISAALEAKLAREKGMCYQPVCLIARFPEGRKDIDTYLRAIPEVRGLQDDVMRLLEELFARMPAHFECGCRAAPITQ
jgi:5'-methylthioadenosine phosphorylase